MPLYCDIRFEPTHIASSPRGPTLLVRWLVNPGQIIEPGTPLARLSAAGAVSELRIRFRCQVGDLAVNPGTLVTSGDALLRVHADGEEIPEGYRYCTTHML